MSQPVQLNQQIQVACLPYQKSIDYPFANTTNFAVGWGATEYDGSTPDLLQNIRLNVFDPIYCANYTDTDFMKQICAGDLDGGKDSCQGDSGGPLYSIDSINGNQTQYVLSGIVSYGLQCGLPNTPGIYTRVVNYLDWIDQNKRLYNNFY